MWSGFLRLHGRSHPDKSDISDLMVNEMARVFYDRCFPDDRDQVLDILREGLRIHFKVSPGVGQRLRKTVWVCITSYMMKVWYYYYCCCCCGYDVAIDFYCCYDMVIVILLLLFVVVIA